MPRSAPMPPPQYPFRQTAGAMATYRRDYRNWSINLVIYKLHQMASIAPKGEPSHAIPDDMPLPLTARYGLESGYRSAFTTDHMDAFVRWLDKHEQAQSPVRRAWVSLSETLPKAARCVYLRAVDLYTVPEIARALSRTERQVNNLLAIAYDRLEGIMELAEAKDYIGDAEGYHRRKGHRLLAQAEALEAALHREEAAGAATGPDAA